MSLSSAAEDYFSKLNPMASRMYVDMKETKLAYEDMWNTLPEDEQKEILSETIIKPEVSLKYPIYKPKDNEEYSLKVVIDDHCSYRDEHSGPFSFKTKSQRDLNLFVDEKPKQKLLKPKPKVTNVYESEMQIELQESPSGLPKTGLDFLDNW